MSHSDLPSTAKAWVLEKFNTPYKLCELPLPTIDDPEDLLIRVEAASYCHTDAVLVTGAIQPTPLPHIGCHEFAGRVVALPAGKQVSRGFRVGDRVAVPGRGHHVCGKCLECQKPSPPLADDPGYSIFCPVAGAGLGEDKPGGFQEYASVDARQVALIPEGVSAVEAAPLMCAGLTVFVALRKCGLQPGQRVGTVGCGGGLGHLGLQFATKMGLKTTGIDVADTALQLARDLNTGATIIDAATTTAKSVRQSIGDEDGRQFWPEMGLDAVLILPESQKAFDYGMDLVRDGGCIMLLSFPSAGFHLRATELVFRRLRIESSLIGSNRGMKEMFEFCLEHKVKTKITTYPFLKLNELVKDYHTGSPGKLVIDMNKEA